MSKPQTKKGARELIKDGDAKTQTRVSARAAEMIQAVALDLGAEVARDVAKTAKAIAKNDGRKTVLERDARLAISHKCHGKQY